MALSDLTYSALQSAIADWLARGDLTTAQVKDCILMAESEFNRRLRVRQMQTSTDLTTTSGVATLPTDYLEYYSVAWSGDTVRQLTYADPAVLRTAFTSTDAGTPVWFTIEGTSFICRPVDDTETVAFRYYQKIPVLSDSNTTNWLLTAHPDLYLAGSMVAAEGFVKNLEGVAAWIQLRERYIDQIIRLSNVTKGGGPIQPVTYIV